MDLHREHMNAFLSKFMQAKNHRYVGDDKCKKMVDLLKSAGTSERSASLINDPKLKWWIGTKNICLVNLPELGIIDRLAVRKEGSQNDGSLSDYRIIVSAGNVYAVIKRLHDSSGHARPKKVKELFDREHVGVARSYIREFCTSCPTCQKSQAQSCPSLPQPIVEERLLSRNQVDDLITMQQSSDVLLLPDEHSASTPQLLTGQASGRNCINEPSTLNLSVPGQASSQDCEPSMSSISVRQVSGQRRKKRSQANLDVEVLEIKKRTYLKEGRLLDLQIEEMEKNRELRLKKERVLKLKERLLDRQLEALGVELMLNRAKLAKYDV